MAQYVPTLNHYSGGLPIISVMYASSDSECTVGINLRPLCDPSELSYTIMPNMPTLSSSPCGRCAATRAVDRASSALLLRATPAPPCWTTPAGRASRASRCHYVIYWELDDDDDEQKEEEERRHDG
ncbi:hypothetical protein HU200_056580 [Digitaria exilis]|uniref:Uncharacterized protein n=1 Tax=Digitaria exilis TaxID=1010633 RepID=A0A835E520_9POAL|nr:hypothetical protein HU200_056580 [Digitaria exilis]